MKSLRVLVADDDAAVRAALAELCVALGHQVVAEVGDGGEAISAVAECDPELLLLDIEMPGLSGLEAARQVLQVRSLPVLIITGHADDNFVAEAARCGAFNYLLKPVSKQRLSAAISTAMARFADMQALRDKVGNLEQSLEERKLIERAKGILMRDMHVKEQEAFSWLKRTSSHHNTKIAEIARRVVALELNRK